VNNSLLKICLFTVLFSSCATENRDALEAEYAAAERASIEALRAEDQQRKIDLFGVDTHTENKTESKPLETRRRSTVALVEPNELDWLVGYYPDPKTGTETCSIVSPTQSITNGTLDTQVNVVITSDLVYFRADAALDISGPESGFRIDANFPLPFDENVNEIAAVFDESYERILTALEIGTVLEVTYANDPHKGAIPQHTVSYDISPLASLVTALNQCSE